MGIKGKDKNKDKSNSGNRGRIRIRIRIGIETNIKMGKGKNKYGNKGMVRQRYKKDRREWEGWARAAVKARMQQCG